MNTMRSPIVGALRPVSRLAVWALLAGWAAQPAAAALAERSPLTLSPANFFATAHLAPWLQAPSPGYVTVTSGCSVLMAPVTLPNGAILQRLTSSVRDQRADQDAPTLIRRALITVSQSLAPLELASVSTAGSSSAIQQPTTTAITQPVIDNNSYSYFVVSRVCTGIDLYGVQVEFRLPLFSDGFESGSSNAWSSVAP